METRLRDVVAELETAVSEVSNLRKENSMLKSKLAIKVKANTTREPE
jgi:hypothetical protein